MDERKPQQQSDRINKLPIPVSVRICGRSLTVDQFLDWVRSKCHITPGNVRRKSDGGRGPSRQNRLKNRASHSSDRRFTRDPCDDR
jgi:hypothetical protein